MVDKNHDIGDEVVGTGIKSLMDEYGIKEEADLAKYGWQKDEGWGKDGYFNKWTKVSNFTNIHNYETITLDRTKEEVSAFVAAKDVKSSIALEAQGYVYYTSGPLGAGYYKWKDIYEIINSRTTYKSVDSDKILGNNKEIPKTTKEDTSKTIKKDITHEYDINYDVQDNLIKAKEQELKRLQEFEENLTGEGLKQNLEQQKKLYEEILELQEQKNEMALKDVEIQKNNLDNLLKEKGLTDAQYDEETGYVTNIGDILREAEATKNAAAAEYNKKVEEGLTGEDLTPYTEAYDAAEGCA